MGFSVSHTLTEWGTESDYLWGSANANLPTPFHGPDRACETFLNLSHPWWHPQLLTTSDG